MTSGWFFLSTLRNFYCLRTGDNPADKGWHITIFYGHSNQLGNISFINLIFFFLNAPLLKILWCYITRFSIVHTALVTKVCLLLMTSDIKTRKQQLNTNTHKHTRAHAHTQKQRHIQEVKNSQYAFYEINLR